MIHLILFNPFLKILNFVLYISHFRLMIFIFSCFLLCWVGIRCGSDILISEDGLVKEWLGLKNYREEQNANIQH
jgi:hypothetical protein